MEPNDPVINGSETDEHASEIPLPQDLYATLIRLSQWFDRRPSEVVRVMSAQCPDELAVLVKWSSSPSEVEEASRRVEAAFFGREWERYERWRNG